MGPDLTQLLAQLFGAGAPAPGGTPLPGPMPPTSILPAMAPTPPAPANPNIMVDPTVQAAAALTAQGAQPPAPVVGKPATALPDQGGSPMLPPSGGDMASYYGDVPDPTQPLTAAGVATPQQQAMKTALSGLRDLKAPPRPEAPRAPGAVSPPGPTVRPEMSDLMQLVLSGAKRPEVDPRKQALAAMLMRG